MDFFQIHTKEVKGGALEAYPGFVVGRSEDLMIRGRAFYAVWDESAGLWSTDEYDVQRLVDLELRKYAEEHKIDNVKYMRSFNNNGWTQFRKFLSQVSDNAHQLDETLTFANSEVRKKDYVSRRLPYALAPGDISAWDELVGTLYAPEERKKIEWAIGAVVSGDSKKIQKFLVLYGPAGTGKSTVLNIIQKLFSGYTTSFEAKALGSNNNTFATEVFGNNPLVAIQHDGDLSQIADNTKLNSIVSHEDMTFNKKYHPAYTAKANAMLWMGTNQPVKISDAKSGIIRRLIDVNPTGVKLQPNHYHTLMARIEFELGAIAHHCLEVYRGLGKNYYNNYQPLEMMFQTDVFFNFIEWNYDIFKKQDGTTLRQAYSLYKEFCTETGIEPRLTLPQYKVREELRNYFETFSDRAMVDGAAVRSYYSGFKAHSFKAPVEGDAKAFTLVLDETISLLDLELADQPAQLAKEDGTPQRRWVDVKTTLADINSSMLHYLKLEDGHIVIDFDLEDENGQKSLEKNLEAASTWPATYAELSKSGAGVHLHYRYAGDPSELARTYADGIEIKVFTGDSSLRRRLSRCNNVPIARIDSGLPLREKKVLPATTIQSEQGLRKLIIRNLHKEIHPGTKPSIDFIKKILEDAYLSGMKFNVEDMRSAVIAFANNSSNRPLECLKVVQQIRWKSDDPINDVPFDPPYTHPGEGSKVDDRVTFFDIEVYPNLLVVCWKYEGDPNVVRMINPTSADIEGLFGMKLVGFNNRRYDNHILWARLMGYDNEAIYKLSKKIIEGSVGSMFGEAYHVSYADIYDFSSKKQGLKKFEIELGIHHMELDLPWDEPVPENLWPKVVEYCVNDVLATEATFESRRGDFVARQILAELSGLTVNDTTAKHTAKIIFGNDRNPQRSFEYTDLSKDFPGYVFERGKSTYRGEEVGEGGYVYAEPGMYENVALLDIASMHPTSIRELNLFGEYTPKFWALVEARLAIKHKNFDEARKLLNGQLAPFLQDTSNTKPLSDALKIVINIVYGLTSAKFDNAFRDIRNVDNIVAKRGALFMINLKGYIQDVLKLPVVHIKTDSVKVPGATADDIRKIQEFGAKYGYDFEHEATYDKFCLVNDAVYVARVGWAEDEREIGKWKAVGAQFQNPYVFKTLFEPENTITFEDLQETKQVTKGAMYLDFDGVTPMALVEGQSTMRFVGRTGRFIPVLPGYAGGNLYRVQEDKRYAVSGTKGYLWIETDMAETIGTEAVDMGYFEGLANEARTTIEKFGSFEEFVS